MQGADDALRWLRQAGHDLDDARFVLTGKRYGLACFLSQQSAEKGIIVLKNFTG
jgi:HEPN domain-containing protein